MEKQNIRIYGKDPGSIKDVESVKNMSEIDLWINIEGLSYHIWYCEHAMAHDRIEHVDLTEEKYALNYLIYQTKKFGVELPEPEAGKQLLTSESFAKWYYFYSHHFKVALTSEEWVEFVEAKNNGQDISKYLPTEKWNDNLEEKKVK